VQLYGFTDRLLIVVWGGAVQCGVLEPSGLEVVPPKWPPMTTLAMFLDDDRHSSD
jgi:hypothetical protein